MLFNKPFLGLSQSIFFFQKMHPPTPPVVRGSPPGESATGPPQDRGTDGCCGQQRAPEQDASDKTIGNSFLMPSSASSVAPPTPPVVRGFPPGESATGLSPRSTLSPTATLKPHLGAASSPTDVAFFPTSPGIAEGEGKGRNAPAVHRLDGHLVPLRGLSARSTAL